MERVKCPYCGKEYSNKGIGTHIWRNHGDGKEHKPFEEYNDKIRNKEIEKPLWNKGLTKDTDSRVKKTGETYSIRYKNGEVNSPWLNKNLPIEIKQKISESMKRAHKEGRAHNIGQSRWNNEPSYPEQFFMKVIENEFEDKDYQREYPISKYSIDFAWVNKKLAIEIDGQQHEKEECKIKDNKKDNYLKKYGWQVLRIKWTDMYNNPKLYIKLAKDFINK